MAASPAFVAEGLERFTDAELYARDDAEPHAFASPAWGAGLFYLVAGPAQAREMESLGLAAGRIVCVCEVLDWRLGGLTLPQQTVVARKKLAGNRHSPCVR